MLNNNKKYYAFISYRHADNKIPGRQWATWLHQAIETYQVPEELVGTKNSQGDVIPSRIFPVFRDEDELPTEADLGKAIVNALDSSQLLIVLCSPQAVSSTYVAHEIHHFKQQGHSDRIIAALIDGEPNASWDLGKQKLGYRAEDECFPVPLQFEYDKNGVRTSKRAEPIAADFRLEENGRAIQSWTSVEAYITQLRRSSKLDKKKIQQAAKKFNQQQHLMLLKIIAGILGIPLGELTRRDKEYQLDVARKKAKLLRRWLSAVFALAMVAIAAGIFAFIKQQQAVEQQRISELRSADSFVANGYLLTRDKKISQAKESLIDALDIYQHFGMSNIAAATQYLFATQATATPLLNIDIGSPISAMHLSTDNRMVIGTTDGKISTVDQLTGIIIEQIADLSTEIIALEFSKDNSKLLAATQSQAVLFELESRQRIFDSNFENQTLVELRFLNDSHQILVVSHYDEVVDGKESVSTNFTLYDFVNDTNEAFIDSGPTHSISLSTDEKRMLVGKNDGANEVLLSPPTHLQSYIGESGLRGHKLMYSYEVTASAYSKNDQYIALGSSDGILEIWDKTTGQQIFSNQYIKSQGVTSVTFSSESPWGVVFGAESGIIRKVSQVSSELLYEHQQPISQTAFPSGQLNSLFSSSLDGHITLLNINKNNQNVSLNTASMIYSLDYSEDGRMLVSTGMLGEEAKIWDSSNGELLSSIKVGKEVSGAVFDRDPSFIWIATEGAIERRNTLTGEKSGELLIENSGLLNLEISADRQHLIMSIDNASENKGSSIIHVPIGGKANLIASEINELTHTTIAQMNAGNISIASTSDAGIIAAVNDKGSLLVWNRKNQKLTEFPLPKSAARVDTLTISKSGHWVITGHVDGKIRVFDSSTGELLRTLKGNDTGLFGVWISPDDRWLISAERAGVVRLWELAKGKQISSFGRNPISKLRVHKQGRISRAVMGDTDYYGDIDMILVNPIEALEQLQQEKDLEQVRNNSLNNINDQQLLAKTFSWFIAKGELEMAANIVQRATNLGVKLPANDLATLTKKQGQIDATVTHLKKAIKATNKKDDKVRYQLMINSFADPDKFMKAIRDNNLTLVNSMLDIGLNPNFIDAYTQQSPLQFAVRTENMPLVELLLEKGSDINFLNHEQATVLFEAINRPAFWKLLISKGINVHQQSKYNNNILHSAAYRGDLQLIKVLLDMKVDKTLRDKDGQTPIESSFEGRELSPEFGERHWEEIHSLLKL